MRGQVARLRNSIPSRWASLNLPDTPRFGEEIATFTTRIDVAEHALLTRLRVFDAHEAWASQGARSCAEWLSWRTNLSIKAAREKVQVARALGCLPKIDGLFGHGGLSYSKVRAITRVATPESEQNGIDVAQHASASQIEKMARAYERVMGDDVSRHPMDLRPDQRRFVRRSDIPARATTHARIGLRNGDHHHARAPPARPRWGRRISTGRHTRATARRPDARLRRLAGRCDARSGR
jgi:hypothetical protein